MWIAITYGRDMLAGPQQVEKASENAPSAARAPPVHHRDAVDEEFAEFASAEAAPVAAKPVEAAPAEAKPVEAVPAVPRRPPQTSWCGSARAEARRGTTCNSGCSSKTRTRR